MAKLEVISGKSSGVELDLSQAPDHFLMGTRRKAALMVKDPWVSFTHAALDKSEEGYLLRDKESKAGTFVNGQRVGGQGVLLQDGDLISLGRTEIRFSGGPAPQASGSSGAGAAQPAPRAGLTPVVTEASLYEPIPVGPQRDAARAAEDALRQAVAQREQRLILAETRVRELEARLLQAGSALPSLVPPGAAGQRIIELEAQLRRAKQQYDETVAAAGARVQDLKRQRNELRQRLASGGADPEQLDALEDERSELSAAKEVLEEAYRDLVEEKDVLEEDIARLRGELGEAQRTAEESQERVLRLQQDLDQAQAQAQAQAPAREEMAALETAIGELNREIQSLTKERDDLKRTLRIRDQELEAARLKAGGASPASAGAAVGAGGSEELEQLQAKLAELTRDCATLRAERDEARASAQALRQDLEDINEDMLAQDEDYQRQIVELKAQLAQAPGGAS